jgi:hypothetical protein
VKLPGSASSRQRIDRVLAWNFAGYVDECPAAQRWDTREHPVETECERLVPIRLRHQEVEEDDFPAPIARLTNRWPLPPG